MKNIVYLFAYLFISSCSAQKKVIESLKQDIVLFSFSEKNISLSQARYYNENYSIAMNIRYLIGTHYGKFDYTFIKNKKDTMNIKCFCHQEDNLYFKNLKFKKGSFELSFDFPKKYNEQLKKYERQKTYIVGNNIKTTKETQNILFKNSDYEQLRKPNYKDTYFRDLKFLEINLKDTMNVKLEQINKK
ncbi:hypothetical protein J2Q11_13605 [Tenacibaculum finnmarkense genomovar finnmarkense]|uniref:hypothetical protein n=1 Tax=Tenacibaculum finnmarkense TaxID=2781243 RepID=UPI001E40D44F|nr:hypothetical protein [Tenacibaculum finnmarkense]MCD8418706.1 hypothetical protein [Tenacibaculum finnmarkense genomovar finnmarkense]MCG8187058.1 hypothetical protein [Tenacibaculum finnmarkense genomovar finnmarkense]MCG8203609.1 hypothetical protein [Tenacibaculum finnmarkense genomovar finnmarkense]MCG8211093.1 hypothetical protein [Tenacibaculum finnmarkense genomovar finnmarkense]MCG8213849.1 hypothetical protein [Tenacibaculum finnmarkense genomovar finnmarkense]